MLKQVTANEGNITREYNDVLTMCCWLKEDVEYICQDYGIDLSNETNKFWNYLSGWLDWCDYFPSESEDIVNEVKEVLKRRSEWEL